MRLPHCQDVENVLVQFNTLLFKAGASPGDVSQAHTLSLSSVCSVCPLVFRHEAAWHIVWI